MASGTNGTGDPNVAAAAALDPRTILESALLYKTKTEQATMTTFMFVVIAVAYSFNVVFIFLVARNPELRTPHVVMLLINACYDLAMVTIYFFPASSMLLTGTSPFHGSSDRCKADLFFLFPFLAENHSIAFLAIERVIYFYKPLVYDRLVTIRRVLFAEAISFLCAAVFFAIVVNKGSNYFSSMGLVCYIYDLPILLWLNFAIFYCPAILAVVVSVVCLLRLILQHQRAIGVHQSVAETSAVNPSTAPGQATAVGDQSGKESTVKAIKTALRVILCVSATYWLTYFPPIIATTVMVTPETIFMLELGINEGGRLLIRCLFLLFGVGLMSNSVVYIVLNSAIKAKFLKLCKK